MYYPDNAHKQEANIFYLKNKKVLGMACITPPLKNGMGPKLGNGISPCFFAFLWITTGHP